MARRVSQIEGVLIGGSGGLAVAAAIQVAKRAGPDDIVVVSAEAVVWGDTVVWRDTVVRGDTVVWGSAYAMRTLARQRPGGEASPSRTGPWDPRPSRGGPAPPRRRHAPA